MTKVATRQIEGTAASVGDVLVWNGTEWVPAILNLSSLTPGFDGQYLRTVGGVPTWVTFLLQIPHGSTVFEGRNNADTDYLSILTWGLATNTLGVGTTEVANIVYDVGPGGTHTFKVNGSSYYTFSAFGLNWAPASNNADLTIQYTQATYSGGANSGSVYVIGQNVSSAGSIGISAGELAFIAGNANGDGASNQGGSTRVTAGSSTSGSGSRFGGSQYFQVGRGSTGNDGCWIFGTSIEGPSAGPINGLSRGFFILDASGEPTVNPPSDGHNYLWLKNNALRQRSSWGGVGIAWDHSPQYRGTSLVDERARVRQEDQHQVAAGASNQVIDNYTLPDNCVAIVTLKGTWRLAGGGGRGAFHREATVYRNGGNATIQGTVTDVHNQSSSSTSATIAVSGNDVQVTGSNGSEVSAANFWVEWTIQYMVDDT